MIKDTELPARNRTGAPIKHDTSNAKRYALLALTVSMIAESVFTLKFIFTHGFAYNQIALWSSLEALVFWWILPILIIHRVECRDWKYLDLEIRREKRRSTVPAGALDEQIRLPY
jgi:hypothetical protein